MAKRLGKRDKGKLAFGADTYRAGALQRLDDARTLKDSQRFALSVYVGGLAVEGMLRSLCCLKSREFDERHDLRKFAVRVEDLRLLRPGKDLDFVATVGAVAKRWRNTLRFADEGHLERFWGKIGSLGPKATIKNVCHRHFDECAEVVRRCEILWSRSRSKN